jgi:hypothetical protein
MGPLSDGKLNWTGVVLTVLKVTIISSIFSAEIVPAVENAVFGLKIY